MKEPTTLTVTHPTGQYDVTIGANILTNLRQIAAIDGPIALVTDTNVGPLHAAQCGETAVTVTIPAGEKQKTLDSVRQIYDALLAANFDRKGTVVALGGGVVGDMAGFAAATYMRGVDFVQCPTSLLAMVDASVGGKTGVDMPQGKNLVGAFKQPTAVLADITTLQTLPPEELAAGLAEAIKHSLIDERFPFARFQHPVADYQTMVADAVRVKRDVVQKDPYEQGRRAVLNLGHTFGHAIEQVSGYAVRHGEGVAMGLIAAANLSARLGYCDPMLQAQIADVLTRANLPAAIPAALPALALYDAMGTDKKKAGGKLRFVLLRGIGHAFVADEVAKTAVIATLKEVIR